MLHTRNKILKISSIFRLSVEVDRISFIDSPLEEIFRIFVDISIIFLIFRPLVLSL